MPEIGCTCPVCTSTDPRDNRLRASSLLHTDDAVILIDCGPDFREQMLRASSFEKIDGVLVTHEHYDHVGGLDDLRPFGRFADIPIYSDAYTAAHLRARMPYCFVDKVYPGVPRIYLQEVEAGQVFHINRTEVLPLRVMHGRLPILGYRIGGRLGYITDMHMMPEESYEQLKGLDVLVMNALRPKPHPTHQSISEALEAAGRIGAKDAVLDTLGLAGSTQTLQLMRLLLARESGDALALLDQLYRGGKDVTALLGELSDLCRDMTVMKAAPEGGAALLSGVYDRKSLSDMTADVPMRRLLFMTDTIQRTAAALPDSIRQRTDAELCLLRLCDESLCGDPSALEGRVSALEDAVRSGAAPARRPVAEDIKVSND